MANRTCESVAESIVLAGGGKELIMQTMQDIFAQAYNRGYKACNNDHLKARAARKRSTSAGFKKEKDQIDDVKAGKWE